MNRPSKFSFIDESEAVRRLDIDRDTLLTFVREKRLKAYPGVGKGNFYRLSEVDALAAELRTQRGATEEQADQPTDQPTTKGKLFDPAYKVHVRLQADLKWYDLSDDELRAWVREMTADGYTRQRANVMMVVERLQRLVALMDEAVAGWQELKPAQPPTTPQQSAENDLPTEPQ
jgi:hypothetical protein